jgi:hypothetical protein
MIPLQEARDVPESGPRPRRRSLDDRPRYRPRRPHALLVTKVPKDAPAWLVEVAGPHWGTTEWDSWESYRAELTTLGVPASHLKPIGSLSRPTEISAHVPSLTPWVSVPIEWQRFGERDALLHAFGELVTEVAKTTT